MSGRPPSLRLYRLLTALAAPFAPLALRRRARRGKEDPGRLGERLGRASIPRPDGPLVWIHGASVGESLSHLPLVERLFAERPDLHLLVTSGTVTATEILAQRLPRSVIHQYLPIDTPGAARRFALHWRPDLVVFVESELWPNLLSAVRRQGARLALLGARISRDSARAWDRVPRGAQSVLGLFDLIYAHDAETRDWIEDHGIEVAGRLDLKRIGEPLPYDAEALAALRAAIGDRRVVVAASTHLGEEILIGEAMRGLQPRPLLIMVPRHPERGGAVAVALSARGWAVLQRSQIDIPGPKTDVYVADTLGELGLLYRLADVVVMGGSFIEGGSGHNPLEPARLGKPVITGPHVDAFAEVYAEFTAERAVLIAQDEAALGAALEALIREPRVAKALGERALWACARGWETFDRVWAALQTLLPPS